LWGRSEKHCILEGGRERAFFCLKVVRQCPLVLLILIE
jgi:hypothetical protein